MTLDIENCMQTKLIDNKSVKIDTNFTNTRRTEALTSNHIVTPTMTNTPESVTDAVPAANQISTLTECLPTLILVRHCESMFNSSENIHSLDVGLSKKGRRQARKLNAYPNVKLIICSPLLRCRQTLRLSMLALNAQCENNILFSELCREHRTDRCDFLKGENIVNESEKMFLKRVQAFKKWVRREWKNRGAAQKVGEKWLVVTHADFIFYLTSKVEYGERFGKWLKNGEALEWTIFPD